MTAPLRLGLVLDNPFDPPAWCARLITQIASEPHIELVALIKLADARPRPASNRFARALFGFERLLIAKPKSADRDAFVAAIADVPLIPSDRTSEIAARSPDVILDLTTDQGLSIDLGLTPFGVWFTDFVGETAGLAALSSRASVVRIALYRRTSGPNDPIGVAEAKLNPKSTVARNALFMCEKAVPLILRALKRAQAIGRPDELPSLVHAKPRSIRPGEVAGYLRHLTRDMTCRGIDYVRSKTRRRPGMFFLKSSQGPLPGFDPSTARPHVSRTDSYFADPFLWTHDGDDYCFFEEFEYRSGLGHISVGRLVDGELVDVRPVLETGYHLSFPYLFEHGGELYMLPETSQVRRLEVWKCVGFPDRWERYATAFEGVCASDSTLNLIDGTWWLFTNISRDPFNDMNSELHVFRVDGPRLTQIEPHAFNPVVIDTNRARNAGRILEIDGKRFRPCQDNSHGSYGYGLRLMEILNLSLDDYDEVEARAIAPDFEPGISGCHHLDVRNNRVVIDVRKKVGGYAG